MFKLYKISICFLLVIILLACEHGDAEQENVYGQRFHSENGLVQECKINELKFSAIYMPNKKIATGSGSINSDDLYFLLRMSYKNTNILNFPRNNNARNGLLKTLSFSMKNYVKIKNDINKTSELKAFTYSHDGGTVPYSDVILVFSKKEIAYDKSNWFIVTVNEFGLFSGNVSFKFHKNDLEKS